MLDFDNMTLDEIHAVSRYGDDQYQTLSRICNYIRNTDRLNTEQMVDEISKEEIQYDNPYAKKVFAELYRDGIFYVQSFELYIEKLKEFFDALCHTSRYGYNVCCLSFYQTAKLIYEENYGGWEFGYVSIDEWRVLSDIGEAGIIIGEYYAGFNDITHMEQALFYLKTSLWCHFDVREQIDFVNHKLESLKGRNDTEASQQSEISHVGIPIITDQEAIKDLENQYTKCKTQMVNSFGASWNKLSDQTKAHLLTAYFTFSQYNSCKTIPSSELDYSGVTSLLMRALEYELDLFFYRGYTCFLERKYPLPVDFLYANGIKPNKWDHRKMIVLKNGTEFVYAQPGQIHFSLGRLEAIIGYKRAADIKDIKMDSTFWEYCNDTLKISNKNDSFVAWIKEIMDSVDLLRNKRNRASHGGSVLSIEETEEAFDMIIWVKKILLILISQLPHKS